MPRTPHHRQRARNAAATIALAVSLALASANAWPPAADAPLPRVTLNASVAGTIGQESPRNVNDGSAYELLRFGADAGAEVVISVEGGWEPWALSVFTADGRLLDRSDQFSFGAPSLRFTAPSDGDYLIAVYGAYEEQFGSYTVSVTEASVAAAGALGVPASVKGQLEDAMAVLDLVVEEPVMVQIAVRSSVFEPILEVFGDDGWYLGGDDATRTGADEALTLLALEPGRYELLVQSFFVTDATPMAFELDVRRLALID